ncbi:MAG: hypothetical protein EXS31_00875 [Pedosphaera sp.]|nr:hypothetical protein [Pedosphaera sp.]
MPAIAETLHLDENSIRPEELSTSTLMRELNLQAKPAWVLRKLMNALEGKRQAKGLGWSRLWNKNGLNIFRSHVHHIAEDEDLLGPVKLFVASALSKETEVYWQFASDLLSDPTLMAFTFYHNYQAEGFQYEGLTVSFGRRVPGDPTKRDRLDLILEDRRMDGRVDGQLDQFRIFVCPWAEYQNGRRHLALTSEGMASDALKPAQELYWDCVRKHNQWKESEGRQWSHWSQRYIDYFGPRSFIPGGTSFN